MGASPLGVTVGLSLRGDLNADWIEKLYQGMSGCLQPYCCPILGGDISRSPVLTISITAFGQVLPQHLIRRSSAQPGDVIVVTGHHGLSRGGLELLLNPSLTKSLEQSNRTEIVPKLILAHQKPQPRLDILPYLQQFPELSGIAGMDSSDGLADAVIQICRASGVGAEIEFNSLPIPQELLLLTSPEQALEWVLYGGEDFELVLALPLSQAQSLVGQIGNGAAIIGKIVRNERVVLKDATGIRREQVLSLDKGFQHFN
jgi:thiamine-monophosphate kinase